MIGSQDLRIARETIVRVGRELTAAGLSPGTTGNLSIRVGGSIVCTPSGSRLGSLHADSLSVITLDGAVLAGPTPTKETFMHRAMYDARADMAAIVHLHSPYATAVSCLRDLTVDDAVPALTPYLTMRAGRIHAVPYVAPGDPAAGPPLAAAVSAGASAILLGNHGSIVGAPTLDDAATIAEELETACRLQLLLVGHEARLLTSEERATLRP